MSVWRIGMIENVVTLICTVVLVLSLYWMGAGGWALWGLLLLLNLNSYHR